MSRKCISKCPLFNVPKTSKEKIPFVSTKSEHVPFRSEEPRELHEKVNWFQTEVQPKNTFFFIT